MTTEYQRRPERISVVKLTADNAEEAAFLVGGHVDEAGTLIVPLYGEGSAVPVAPSAFVWIDELGPHVETDPERFSTMWAEVVDGPTIRERVEKLEALVSGIGLDTAT